MQEKEGLFCLDFCLSILTLCSSYVEVPWVSSVKGT